MLIINALLEQIRKRSALLDSVTHLDISIDLQNGNSLDPHPGLVGDIAQAVSLGNEFAQLVPGITYYEWPFVTNDDVLLAFIRAATKHYASNLSRISCELTVLSDVEHFSDKLRHLDIRCYSNDFSHFPLVQSAQLKMLRLIGIEKEFTWSSFQGDKGPNVLDFSSLKHLSLGVPFVTEEETQDNSPDTIWYGPADLFEYTVLAPQLVKFRTQLCPFSLSCLSSITGVDILPEVEILTMAKVVLKITNLKLNDVIKRKFSGYAKESVHNMLYMNWIDFANDIFCIPDFAENTRIDLNSIGSSFDASTINWPYLNCLIIRERIDIEYMLMLIKQLPNLTELKVFNLKLILTDDGHLSIPEIYESSDDELQPLDVNIKRITLMAGPLLLPATLQADTTEYLCKRLPSLDIVEY
ncbi:hypothetical protein IW140_002397 [Coemansia sp. RSA 1813]|nr:hypothetical protein LPJ74_000952 [Coemansia sp. RSA 1843]KAJ2570304.1 hypothetical protein IW140_002397 [Coemansia sp. RSA 1813]